MPVFIAVPDGVKCAKNAFEEESPKEDTQPIKKALSYMEMLSQNL